VIISIYYFYFFPGCPARAGLPAGPTWAPFRLQFSCNGHNWLARRLGAEGIGYTMADMPSSALTTGAEPRNWPTACRLIGCIASWIAMRNGVVRCLTYSGNAIIGALMQVEYATDLAFHSTATLGPLHEQLIRESVLSVKAGQIAIFLGRQITPRLAREIGSRFSTRVEGTRIKHRFGKSSIKMYDKAGIVPRIETTTNDVSFFKHHRKVEHRKGPPTRALAPVRKSIYSLIGLREILLRRNRRYLPTSLPWTTARRGFARSAASPGRVTWMAGPSRRSTSSRQETARCRTPRGTRGLISPASAGATSCRTAGCSRQPGYQGSCADRRTSG
jgi:hypothetical protein